MYCFIKNNKHLKSTSLQNDISKKYGTLMYEFTYKIFIKESFDDTFNALNTIESTMN